MGEKSDLGGRQARMLICLRGDSDVKFVIKRGRWSGEMGIEKITKMMESVETSILSFGKRMKIVMNQTCFSNFWGCSTSIVQEFDSGNL